MRDKRKHLEIEKVIRNIDTYLYKGHEFYVIHDESNPKSFESNYYIRHPNYPEIQYITYSTALSMPDNSLELEENNMFIISKMGDMAIEEYYFNVRVKFAKANNWPIPENPCAGHESPKALFEAELNRTIAEQSAKVAKQKAAASLKAKLRRTEKTRKTELRMKTDEVK